MFARAATRTFQAASGPLKMSSRQYATTPSGGTNNTAILAGAALAIGAGSYYAFTSSAGTTPAKKAEAKVGEVVDAAKAAAKEAFTGGEQGFVPLTVESVKTLNHNTKLVRFKLPEEDQVSGMHTASALLTKFKPEGAEKAIIRPYTPVSDDDTKGHMELLVKRYEGGKMSSHIHSLAPGDKLDVKGPIVKYPWSPNKHEEIALVAGGTGITPMYQLIKAVLQNTEVDKTKITLVYGNIAEEDILLHKELRTLENTFPQRFRTFYVLEKPPAEWQGTTGYVTKELLKQVLPEPKGENFKVFVCGPPGLMKAVSGPKKAPTDQGELTGLLQELGYNKDQVLKF
ncbi:NADH-cytochrome b5 reductase [Sporothrix eucalyptigena]|uniref:NADH-cytochrome b5 reductase n=1 Tax=Sporothrix eucalyptigena TaxID=1812306 RepID=A0ABP0AKM7_9PEZI